MAHCWSKSHSSVHPTHLQFSSFAMQLICNSSEKLEIKMKLTLMLLLLLLLLLLLELLLLVDLLLLLLSLFIT